MTIHSTGVIYANLLVDSGSLLLLRLLYAKVDFRLFALLTHTAHSQHAKQFKVHLPVMTGLLLLQNEKREKNGSECMGKMQILLDSIQHIHYLFVK